MKSTVELCQIATAGGGIKIDAGAKSTLELCQIATAGCKNPVSLIVTNSGLKSTVELCQIAVASKGTALFEF